MWLGVIICPHCKKAKGVDLSAKTTKCTYCGKTLQIKKLKKMYETDSQEKLRQAIGLLNAKIQGNDIEVKNFNKS
jgi:hypothetical protein